MIYIPFLRSLVFGCFLLLNTLWAIASSPKREVRAVWLTTLSGLDWPTTYAHGRAGIQAQKEELCDLLDRLQAAGINTVLLQTRIRGTVIYPSALEPWDGCLSGTPGKAPGYDPLAFAVEESHRRGMELHAWVVAFPVCSQTVARQLGKQAFHRKHPELCQRTGDRWMMDPGVPETADYLARLCGEIAANYDVDGIHLDYIRYPEKEIPFNDRTTYNRYGQRQNKAEWRRNNVTRCVTRIHRTVKTLKPWVKMSCAPVGKAEDLSRYSSRGWNAYHAVSQDAQGWLRNGLMDMLFPMMYFRGDHFYPFALDWTEQAEGRPIVPGLGIYFLSPKEKDWPLSTITQEMEFLRTIGAGGQAFFRSRFFTDNLKGLYRYTQRFYTRPALTPALTWEDSSIPETPTDLRRIPSTGRITLEWTPATTSDKRGIRYNVYRSDRYPVDTEDAANLIRANLQQANCELPAWTPENRHAYYAVTAMNRFGNESLPATSTPPIRPTADTRLLPNNGKTVSLPAGDADKVIVTDMTGQTVCAQSYRTELPIGHLASGFYRVGSLNKKGRSFHLGCFIKK